MLPLRQTNRATPALRAAIALAPLLLLLLLPALAPAPAAAQSRGPVYVVAVDEVVTRYSAAYLRRAVQEAEASGAELLVVRLGAGGAVLRDLRELADDLAGAQVPVVVHVTPGVRSGAAGVWLLSAAHIAAMAPDTSFGVPRPLVQPGAGLTEQTQELLRAETIDRLAGWAGERGRSDAWVEQAVRQGAVLNNEQAAAGTPPAVDLVARDMEDLLIGLEGRVVTLEGGTQRTLATLGRAPQPLPPTLWEQALILLASPTIAFMLLVMAGIAVYAELVTPTVGALGALGFLLFVGALVGLTALPVRWLAVAGLLLAFGVIAADLYTPSHGALTVVGLVLLVASALTMFDSAQAPGVAVALWTVLLVAAFLAAFAGVGIYLAVRARRTPVSTGQEGLVGRLAEVRKRLDPEGFVFVEGALWRAVSEEGEIEQGEWVRVTAVYALRLTVRRVAEEPPAAERAAL
jgi:membrane-bound serine protease (ClpP class)